MLSRGFNANEQESGVQSDLLRALGGALEDPDVDVPRWLAGHTPLGID